MAGAPKKKMVGRYEVGWTIGHGSFGKVKFAVDADTGVPVAMKVLDKATILNHHMLQQMGDMDDMEDFEGIGDEDDDGDEDDMEEPVTKEPKQSDSDSSSKIGRKSRKVITKVEEDEDTGSRQRTRMLFSRHGFSNMLGVDVVVL
ncbi:hypothetical protein ZWY2020_014983 [Hordeum vulgare]|nr:hypothetical protein ZWY2020_014983 [Hordeum vulgare]